MYDYLNQVFSYFGKISYKKLTTFLIVVNISFVLKIIVRFFGGN
jgi:hypothetical protein